MRTISAVYEGGVFHPRERLDLKAGSVVFVIVPDERDPVEIMKEKFPNSFGGLPDEDADEMMKAINEEFGRIDANEWR